MLANTQSDLSVTVSREDFEQGRFPNVCPQTGLLAINRKAAIATKLGLPKATGFFYLHSSVEKGVKMIVLPTVILTFGSLIAAVVGYFAGNLTLTTVALAVLVITALGSRFLQRDWTRVRMTDEGAVELKPVARDFYDAMALRPMKCTGCENGTCGC